MDQRKEPSQGETWREICTGSVFTIRAVDHWPSSSVTVFAINVPARRTYSGPMDSFLERFEEVSHA